MAVSNAKLLLTTLRNSRCSRINREMIGFTITREAEPVTHRIMEDYAAATNDPNPLYGGEEGFAPPLLVSRLVFPFIKEIMVHKDLNLNILKLVHAWQQFRWTRPLRAGDKPTIVMRIESIEDTSAGEMMTLVGSLSVGDETIGEARAGIIIRGGGKKGGNKEKKAEQKPVLVERARIEMSTTKDQALRYAAASTDTNFIHTSPFLAKLSGLPGTILHGLCTMAMANAALTNALLGGDLRRSAGVCVRFALPVLPGQTLTLVCYEPVDDPKAIPFVVQNAKGKVVIKDGVFLLR